MFTDKYIPSLLDVTCFKTEKFFLEIKINALYILTQASGICIFLQMLVAKYNLTRM